MSTAASGVGTNHSSSYYLRNFYISNRDARTSSSRYSMNNSELSLADSQAMRQAIRNLGNMEFSDDTDTSVRNTAKAFVEVYNNTLSSASDSSDHTLQHNMKQLKSLAEEYSSDLDKIGITVNSDGSLTCRSSLFSSASISKFENLFSSSSSFMQRASACAKRIERQSNSLVLTEKNQKLLQESKNKNTSSDVTAIAELFAEGTDLDTVLDTGIGQNVNVVL